MLRQNVSDKIGKSVPWFANGHVPGGSAWCMVVQQRPQSRKRVGR
jgi:Cft2 family RNA processing exonuclease